MIFFMKQSKPIGYYGMILEEYSVKTALATKRMEFLGNYIVR